MARITVTQLKHACLDSSWLDRWLRDPDVALPAPREWSKETGVPAKTFHELAQKFAEWLCDPATGRNAIRLDSYEKLWGALWQELAQKEVLAILRKKGPEAANRLSQALRSWCRRLTDLREDIPNRPGWETLLLTSEYTFQDTPFPTSGKPVVIAGKPDCVRLQSDGIVVVDYKLSRGANLKSDLLQVVIYAALLRATRPSLEFSTQLEYYEPELHLVSQSADEAIQLFEDQVRPVLEKIGTHQPGRRQPGAVGNRCWPR